MARIKQMKIQRQMNFGREKGYESSQVSGCCESGMKVYGGARARVRDKARGGWGADSSRGCHGNMAQQERPQTQQPATAL